MGEDLKYFSQRETGAVSRSQVDVCEYFDFSFSDFSSSLEKLDSRDISRCVGLCPQLDVFLLCFFFAWTHILCVHVLAVLR